MSNYEMAGDKMFDRIERLIGRENLSKINDKTVLVVGLGGVGGSCVLSLVRSGIKKVVIVDFDVVDLSNLNRQAITFRDNIGHKKVDVCYETIKKINPDCEVIKYDMFLDSENIKNVFDTTKIKRNLWVIKDIVILIYYLKHIYL